MPIVNTGTESNAVSAHGTLVYRNGTLIPELTDVRPPILSRETHENTRHGDDDDSYRVGIRIMSLMYFTINLLFDDPEHLGLLEAWETTQEDTWVVHFADGAEWTFNGFVCEFGPSDPVDGMQSAQVAVRPSGDIAFGGVLLLETGGQLLQENGGGILL